MTPEQAAEIIELLRGFKGAGFIVLFALGSLVVTTFLIMINTKR